MKDLKILMKNITLFVLNKLPNSIDFKFLHFENIEIIYLTLNVLKEERFNDVKFEHP